MGGNMEMSRHLTEETHSQNSFWAEVYYYMEDNDVGKDEAMAKIESRIKEEKEKVGDLIPCDQCGGSGYSHMSYCGNCHGGYIGIVEEKDVKEEK